MPDFWFFLTSTALFDSFSTALQIVIFVFFFSTKKPLANSLAFLAGIGLSYIACGMVFLSQMEAVNRFISQLIPKISALGERDYYLLQLAFGLLCAVAGIFFWFKNKSRQKPSMSEQLALVLKLLNPVTAALFGAFLTVVSFPFSLPYLGALEKLASTLGTAQAIPGLFYYNLIYISPMLVCLVVYLSLRHRIHGIEAKLHLHSQKWGTIINYLLTVLLGLLFAADSLFFFLRGIPLLASKFF